MEEIAVEFSFRRQATDVVHSVSILMDVDYNLFEVVNTEINSLVFLPIISSSET